MLDKTICLFHGPEGEVENFLSKLFQMSGSVSANVMNILGAAVFDQKTAPSLHLPGVLSITWTGRNKDRNPLARQDRNSIYSSDRNRLIQ